MKRLVSYIYKYENGSKGENIGFGKIDTDDNQIKMNISLRCNENKEHLEVYFFVREDVTKLVFVGDAVQKNGSYELKKIVNMRDLTEGKYSTSDIHGIIIRDDTNIRFISFWKDEYIIRKCVKWNEIMVLDISDKSGNRNNIMEDSYEVIEEDTVYLVDRNCVPIESIDRENAGINRMEVTDNGQMNYGTSSENNTERNKNNTGSKENRNDYRENAEEIQNDNIRESNEMTENEKKHRDEAFENEEDNISSDYMRKKETENKSIIEEQIKGKTGQNINEQQIETKEKLEKTDKDNQNNNNSRSILERFFGKQRIGQYVIDKNKLPVCRIIPKDIYVLPRCCWNNVRNAYLCHCFMKYGGAYLIEADGIYIGVPGYKTINDEIMAGKYGFKRFMECEVDCLGVSSNMNWKRGFWCKKLMPKGSTTL
ncbi:MAG: hypothetical protein K2M73_11705 [Lachnospiraceae bacterium]|nr:hypothetical protein [Lachnospiraceae bacterium]